MASKKKKTAAKTVVKFRDLKSKKNPKGGTISWSGSTGGDDVATPQLKRSGGSTGIS
jgi:hypothetical protein